MYDDFTTTLETLATLTETQFCIDLARRQLAPVAGCPPGTLRPEFVNRRLSAEEVAGKGVALSRELLELDRDSRAVARRIGAAGLADLPHVPERLAWGPEVGPDRLLELSEQLRTVAGIALNNSAVLRDPCIFVS